MRRSAIALWATLCALALTAGPAAAQDARQTVEDSALAGQVGPVQVNAPVRVASDGNNEHPRRPWEIPRRRATRRERPRSAPST